MFQQIDLSWKVVNNLIVWLNWALNENGDIALFISRNTLYDKTAVKHGASQNLKEVKESISHFEETRSVAVKPVLVVVEKKVNGVSRSSFKVNLIRISLLAVI